MIIKCPSCRNQISSKVSVCPHCGFELGEMTDEKFEELERRKLRDRIYRLKMSSYGAITVLLAAAGWYFYETADMDITPSTGPIILVAVGSVAYVVVRGLLFKAKRELKAL